MWRATTWRWEGKSFYADLGQSKFSCFPVQILSSLAVQEIPSVWPRFYSSFANGCFFCCFRSPTKLIGSAWLFRFCPNAGGLTLEYSRVDSESPRHTWKFLPQQFPCCLSEWIQSEYTVNEKTKEVFLNIHKVKFLCLLKIVGDTCTEFRGCVWASVL